MAMSSITVAGITPTLSILGAFQEFIYDQSTSAFRLYNTFVPIIGTNSVTNFEFRNNNLNGFRWSHTTNTTDTIGQLKLQSFVGASPTGSDILSFNNDGSVIIYSPITIPTTISVAGSAQQFRYNSVGAEFMLKNIYVNSSARYSIHTDIGYRTSYGYDSTKNETYINSDIPIAIYADSTTAQMYINGGTNEITINSNVTCLGDASVYAFTLNNTYENGFTKYVIEQDGVNVLELGYEDDVNIGYIKSTFPLDIIINGDTTCIFNENNIDLNSNSIVNGSWDGNTINVSKGGTGQTTLTSNALLTGNGISAINQITPGTNGTVLIGNTGGAPSFSSTPSVSSISITNAPVNSSDGVNKSYVDALYAGIEFKQACYAATTTNLLATYDNGTTGLNATLTSTSFGTFTIDGLTPTTGKRILVKNQSISSQNGVYTVFNVGGPAAFWVLKRATDFDQPDEINPGVLVPVEFGNMNAVSSWIETGVVNTIGTDAIDFTAFTYSPDAFLEVALNLSDLANITTARTNLGLTNVATQIVTTNAVLLGAASNTINSVNLTNGQILIGSTGGTPVGAIPSNSTNISWTAGAGSLTANISGQIGVVNGGTGLSITTPYGVICGGTTSTGNFQNAGAGTAGQVLTSNGVSSLPTWQNASSTSAYGSMWFQGNITASSSTSFVIITGTTIAGSFLNGFTHTNKRLTYTGATTIRVYVSVYVRTKFSNTGFIHTYIIAKNGTTFNESQGVAQPNASTYNPLSLFFHTIIEVTTNDYIEVYMKTTGGNMTPEDITVIVAKI